MTKIIIIIALGGLRFLRAMHLAPACYLTVKPALDDCYRVVVVANLSSHSSNVRNVKMSQMEKLRQ